MKGAPQIHTQWLSNALIESDSNHSPKYLGGLFFLKFQAPCSALLTIRERTRLAPQTNKITGRLHVKPKFEAQQDNDGRINVGALLSQSLSGHKKIEN